MSDMIKVPYSELMQRAATIRQQASLVRSEVRSLDSTVESIQWMGKRAERFFNMWQEAKPDMEAWASILEAFADSLQDQARRMQMADEAF